MVPSEKTQFDAPLWKLSTSPVWRPLLIVTVALAMFCSVSVTVTLLVRSTAEPPGRAIGEAPVTLSTGAASYRTSSIPEPLTRV